MDRDSLVIHILLLPNHKHLLPAFYCILDLRASDFLYSSVSTLKLHQSGGITIPLCPLSIICHATVEDMGVDKYSPEPSNLYIFAA